MTERDDYPALAALADAAEGRDRLPEAIRCYLELGALRSRLNATNELLRRHVMDWGECDHPDDCKCSHALALRTLEQIDAQAIEWDVEP